MVIYDTMTYMLPVHELYIFSSSFFYLFFFCTCCGGASTAFGDVHDTFPWLSYFITFYYVHLPFTYLPTDIAFYVDGGRRYIPSIPPRCHVCLLPCCAGYLVRSSSFSYSSGTSFLPTFYLPFLFYSFFCTSFTLSFALSFTNLLSFILVHISLPGGSAVRFSAGCWLVLLFYAAVLPFCTRSSTKYRRT